jgi:heterodisulfide reductase subunit A
MAESSGAPRIGIYICDCGSNIAGKVDVPAVVEFAGTLPNVAVAREYKYMCSDPGQELIQKDIKEMGLDRVVVAACSPTMHEPTFRKAVADAGLNQFLFQMANIREHDSWVTEDPVAATEKAKHIVEAAAHRVVFQEALEPIEVPMHSDVLVVGGGIAGIEAALKLADSGHKVYLVERDPSIGGHMAQFDKTFPTLDCSACILTPKMSAVGKHPNIELMAYSEVTEVDGYVGNFKVKVKRKNRYVDIEKCTGCGLCTEACVVGKVPNEFNEGLDKRHAAYIPFPQAVPLRATIDPEKCLYLTRGKCKQTCLEACGPDAISFDLEESTTEIEVGAIIMATGFEMFESEKQTRYGYGKLEDVITSLEFERISNASGPTGGHILCKSGEKPRSVAILHCVGSRDENFNEHCSRVCCMYSLKFSHLIKEHLPETEVYQCYIDMRCFGKGYEEFYKRLMNEGVVFIRGRAAEVTAARGAVADEEGRLVVTVEDTLLGVVRHVPVDMVILSSALESQRDAKAQAQLFGFGCSYSGFFIERHPKLEPVSTVTDGIFIAGCCQGPKDIPDTVAQAGAAAAGALALVDNRTVKIEPTISYIDPEKCSGCRICISLCPHNAIVRDEEKGVAKVIDAACKGCGVCVSACGSNVPQQRGFLDDQIFAEIEGALA